MIKKIPFISFKEINFEIKEDILKSFSTFFDSGNYILGTNTINFERAYSNFSNTKYCVGLSNGMDALRLSLLALDIGKGDEVIVQANTFIASVLAIYDVGAKPIFVEPNLKSYNIDVELIENKITSNTKAIMPVHLYGQPCEMDKILTIAKKYDLLVIEDNAQAQGATWNGKITGSFGDINAVSFYPGKNLGALGDAGAITTNKLEYFEKIKMLRNYGSVEKYKSKIIGFNNRIDECQSGFLSVKLTYLTHWNDIRRKTAAKYFDALKCVDNIILPEIVEGANSVFHQFIIRTKSRDRLQNYLKSKGIQTIIHYPIPPHLQTCFKSLNYSKGDFPVTELLCDTSLSLPIWPGLKDDDINYITSTIKTFFNQL